MVPSCAGQASAPSGVNSNLWLRGLAQSLFFCCFCFFGAFSGIDLLLFLSVSEGFGCGGLVFPLRQPTESLEPECGRDHSVWAILVFLSGF